MGLFISFYSSLWWVLLVGTPSPGEVSADRVAVVPIAAIGVALEECEQLREQLSDRLVDQYQLRLIPSARTDESVKALCGNPTSYWDCLGQDQTMLSVGTQLKAKTVLAASVAAIGGKQVLKLRIANIQSGRVFTEVVETGKGEKGDIIQHFMLLNEQFFSQNQLLRPWYRNWKIWALVGGGLVVLGGIIAYSATASGGSSSWDHQRNLP